MKRFFLSAILILTNFYFTQSQDCPKIFETERGKAVITKNRIKSCKEYRITNKFLSKSRYLLTVFEFDKNTNIIKVDHYLSNDSLQYSEVYNYNVRNQLIEEYWLKNGNKSMIDTFIYQNDILIETHSSYGWHTCKKYDTLGRLVESYVFNDKIKENKNDSILFEDRLFKYEYSIDITRDIRIVNTTKNGKPYIYEEYDSLNRIISRTQYEQTEEFIYNSENQLIFEKYVSPDKGYSRIIKYDKFGNVKNDNGTKYFYDNDFNLIQLKNFRWTRFCRYEKRRKIFQYVYEKY